MDDLHPIVLAAGKKRTLPNWAEASEERRRHLQRVGRLMWKWSGVLGLPRRERVRWRAAGVLHDALKGSPPNRLGSQLLAALKQHALAATLPEMGSNILNQWPGSLLHGPACAARLHDEGVTDRDLLMAVAFHTTGHAGLERIGQALYAADFLEPGRVTKRRTRAALRQQMPTRWLPTMRTVAAAKIDTLLKRSLPLDPITVDFWNSLAASTEKGAATPRGR